MRPAVRSNSPGRTDGPRTPIQLWVADWQRRSARAHQWTGNAQRDLLQRLHKAGDLSYEVARRWAVICEREAQANLAACEASVQG